jgi:hypothetical protein
MRVSLLIAATLMLSACGKNDQGGSNQNVEEGLTAESIVSNDVTAIDAVTGDAANMAADVDMNFGNLDENVGVAGNETKPSKPAASRPAEAKTAPTRSASPAESNTTTANSMANAE